MITKSEKKKLKKHLKSDYVEDVLQELSLKNITNREGKPYSESMIRMVLSGTPNQHIEDAILTVYSRRKQQFEAREARKKELLSA